jgi:hypothetical protein
VQRQLPPTPTPSPTPTITPTPAVPPTPTPATAVVAPVSSGKLTYNDTIGAIFQAKCSACHNDTAMAGLNLLTYTGAMKGGKDGVVIVASDPAGSLLVKKQSGDTPHFGQLSLTELQQVTDWIKAGALEK